MTGLLVRVVGNSVIEMVGNCDIFVKEMCKSYTRYIYQVPISALN